MKKRNFIVLLVFTALFASILYLNLHAFASLVKENQAGKIVAKLQEDIALRNGDIIFQTSLSAQSRAIQLATHSPYSHCGILYREGNDLYVYEAIQPVQITPLEKWIARGKDGHFVVKRLKNADKVLTPTVLQRMKKVGSRFNGKNYDLYFEWSDDRIYCSELVWKIYQEATGLEIGKPEKLKDFDLSAGPVKAKMEERYGKKIPLEEKVISPARMFQSELLEAVITN